MKMKMKMKKYGNASNYRGIRKQQRDRSNLKPATQTRQHITKHTGAAAAAAALKDACSPKTRSAKHTT